MAYNIEKQRKAIAKELAAVEKQEQRLAQAAMNARPAQWREFLEKRIPDKVSTGLESAFCKGFAALFSQGKSVIEIGFRKEDLREDHVIRDFAFQIKGGRRELRQMAKGALRSDLKNLAVTTVEGIGLGALGIGMPDIVLFLGNLLGGIYETALSYGYDYESPQEQMLILKMMAASLSSGQDWARIDQEVEQMLRWETLGITENQFQAQLRHTASIFAMDMLLLKFIQGLPLVGIVGGAANPIYYSRVMKYVQLKYRKRYLLNIRL